MVRPYAAKAVLAAVSLFGAEAWAYTPTLTSGGVPVRFHGQAKLNIAGNPRNANGLSAEAVSAVAIRSLQRWRAASAGATDFDYWQGEDAGTYTPNSEYNGLSSLYFASNAQGGTGLSSNVLGLTQVWYNTDTGEILEADIVLNDSAYRFTLNAQDTSGYGSLNGGSGGVFIENVLTHEVGHAYGLGHSGHLQSTMLFMESPEQAYLGCDEQAGIRALYAQAARGVLNGTVVSESGSAVFGAHVQAISRRRGTVLGAGVTDKSGRYSIGGLEPGSYFLMAEPFYAGNSALPSYYSTATSRVCGSQEFSRTLLAQDTGGNRPVAVSASANAVTEVPTLTAECSTGPKNAAIQASPGSSSLASAPVVASGNGGFGFADRFGFGMELYYRLSGVSGKVEARVLSYSLYSSVGVEVDLLDSTGQVVSGGAVSRASPVYRGSSGYANYDGAAVADGLPLGDYTVRVRGTGMGSAQYPAGPVSQDQAPFFVLTGSVNESGPPLSGSLPFNSRCRMEENFPAYTSPAGGPRKSGEEDAVGFCGTVRTSGGNGPGPGAMAGWLLPWLVMLAGVRAVRASLGRQHSVVAASPAGL